MVEVVDLAAHELEQQLHHLEVAPLPVRADQIRLPDPPLLQDREHGRGVILGVDPVAHVLARAVQTWPHPVDQAGDLSRDELLHVLARAVVVRAVRQRGPHAEGPHPGADQQIAARLRRRVGARGVVRRGLREPLRGVEVEFAVDLVGRDVVEARAVTTRRLQQRERADEVGVQERARVVERVVVVGLRRAVHDRIALPRQRRDELLDERRIGDVSHDQTHAVRRQAVEIGGRSRIGELVQHGHARIGVREDVADEAAADEAGTAGDEQVTGHQREPPGASHERGRRAGTDRSRSRPAAAHVHAAPHR